MISPYSISLKTFSPFGVTLANRNYTSSSYGYGFNGMEKDDEVKGENNSYDFGARMLDVRLGRWLSVDPLAMKYPSYSTYSFVNNIPIKAIDPTGKYIEFVGTAEDLALFDCAIENLRGSEEGERIFQALVSSPHKVSISITTQEPLTDGDLINDDIIINLRRDDKKLSDGTTSTLVTQIAHEGRHAERKLYDLIHSEVAEYKEENDIHDGGYTKEIQKEGGDYDEAIDFEEWDGSFSENLVRTELGAELRYAYKSSDGTIPVGHQTVKWDGTLTSESEGYVYKSPTLIPYKGEIQNNPYNTVRNSAPTQKVFNLETRKTESNWLTKELTKTYHNTTPSSKKENTNSNVKK